MITKTRWLLKNLMRRIWVRASMLGLLGVLTALAGVLLGPMVPESVSAEIGADAVDQILGILASSMLAVVTFSLSIAVQAFSAADRTATPRAAQLLQENHTTQNVLATFIGAFLFSLVGIIALNAGIYGNQGRVLLFAATIAVVLLVVASLLRWINHLMSFGRMSDTLRRVEEAATKAVRERTDNPYLGGVRLDREPPTSAVAVFPESASHVQHIDMEALSNCAEEMGAELYLAALPGSFRHPADPLLYVQGAAVDEDVADSLRDAFTMELARNYDQDPRFGLIVLSEIASRALSSGVNDPGTAIDVLGRLLRVLSGWREPEQSEPSCPRVHVPPLQTSDLLDDAFRAILRDGAGVLEVQMRLHKTLHALTLIAPETFCDSARRIADEARDCALGKLGSKRDRERLEALLSALWKD